MSERIGEIHLEAWRNFITAHARLIDQIDRELIEEGKLPLHWYDVLIELVEAPEHRLRMTELARKVVLSKSGLTRLVDRLEKAELLIREADPKDGRGAFAVLTDKGIEAVHQSWPVYARSIKRYFADYLSDEEAAHLSAMMSRILNGIS